MARRAPAADNAAVYSSTCVEPLHITELVVLAVSAVRFPTGRGRCRPRCPAGVDGSNASNRTASNRTARTGRGRISRLVADALSLAYDDRMIVDGLSLQVPTGQITVIVGANACGKSTLLRGLARLMKPKGGVVLLDGEPIHRSSTREVATKLGILPQQPIAPDGLSVGDLVSRGRHPHQRWFRQWSAADEAAVDLGAGTDRLDRSGDAARRRALRWATPAGVDRDGARPGHAGPVARRADDVPRSRPPVRGDGSPPAPQRDRWPHDRRRAARPQPGVSLRTSPDRDQGRCSRRHRDTPTRWSPNRWWPTCSVWRCVSSKTRSRAHRWCCHSVAADGHDGGGARCRVARARAR